MVLNSEHHKLKCAQHRVSFKVLANVSKYNLHMPSNDAVVSKHKYILYVPNIKLMGMTGTADDMYKVLSWRC